MAEVATWINHKERKEHKEAAELANRSLFAFCAFFVVNWLPRELDGLTAKSTRTTNKEAGHQESWQQDEERCC